MRPQPRERSFQACQTHSFFLHGGYMLADRPTRFMTGTGLNNQLKYGMRSSAVAFSWVSANTWAR